MRSHLDEHAWGRLCGEVPPDWLEDHGLGQCTVCSRYLSRRYGGACPRCRPELRTGQRPSGTTREVPEDYPSLEKILSAKIPCKSYVPEGAKKLWAQCLVTSVAQAVEYNDVRSWTELLMLQKCVLRASSRGGKSQKKKLDAETKRLCKAWLEGQRSSLCKQAICPRRQSQKSEPSQQERFERASALTKEFLLQKACGSLVNEPPAEVTNAIADEMRIKHPRAREADTPRLSALREVNAAVVGAIQPDEVKRVIKDFPKGSASGPSGLKPQHLKDAIVPGWGDEVARQVSALLSLLARGHAPQELQRYLCGATLVTLKKKDGAHRPVAVGDTWRRLVAKALCRRYARELKKYSEPVQLGVGTKAGCEAIVHTTRQWLGRNRTAKDKVFVKMDLSNAFNAVGRSAVLAAVRRIIPGVAPWADFCYNHESLLWLDSRRLSSARGVQQGDPLGPAFFALAIHEKFLRAKSVVEHKFPDKLDFSVFYLDDGVVAGSDKAVALFCSVVQGELGVIGLDLSFGKCEVIPAAADQNQVSWELFDGFEQILSGNFLVLRLAHPHSAAHKLGSARLRRKSC